VDWQAIGLTIRLAACRGFMVIGMPVAYWLARSSWRWKFWWKR
jgi:ABC-type spermidine/putrescine transport system permease subunit I